MRISDWSSDVCSSDLVEFAREEAQAAGTEAEVVGAKEVDRVAARPRALLARDAVQSARAHLVPQRRPAIGAMRRTLGRREAVDQADQIPDDRRQLEANGRGSCRAGVW